MSEGPSEEQVAQPLKIRRVGKTFTGIFIVFAITLLAFGRVPLVRYETQSGYGVNFNIIPVIGIVGAIFAVGFIVVNLGTVLKLAKPTMVIGLIGGVGLVIHSVLAIFMPLGAGPAGPSRPGAADLQPLARQGAEEWTIDGKPWSVSSTYYLHLPEGVQYTIEFPCRFTRRVEQMDDERALEIVFPLIKHAYANKLYLRESEPLPTRIGVVLFETVDGRTRGYRIALSLDEVRKRIESGGAGSPEADEAAGTKSQ